MISNNLSLVEALRPASDELAAQVEQYLAAGGRIEEGPASGYIPKPITYSNQMPPAPKPFVQRRVEAAPLPLDKTDIRSQDRLKMAEQIRQLGLTLTQTEVAAELGVSRRLIYNYAARYDITFKAPIRGGARNLVRKEVDEARDAKLAERIRAFLELGITRRQCCGKLAIGNKAFERIIAAHGIDYPKARRGSTSCAA
jgi:transposase